MTEASDLTARARIRDAALQAFAQAGYAGATIRSIAEAAGVSPGLVRHHFGSKETLRQACDDYVLEALKGMNSQLLDDPARAARGRPSLQPFQRYLARALVDGSATVAASFEEMVTMTEQWLARADRDRTDPPAVERRVRAAVVTAMAAGIPLLHQHVSRALGADMFSPQGDRLITLALLDIYSHRLLSAADAATADAGLDAS